MVSPLALVFARAFTPHSDLTTHRKHGAGRGFSRVFEYGLPPDSGSSTAAMGTRGPSTHQKKALQPKAQCSNHITAILSRIQSSDSLCAISSFLSEIAF